MTKPALLPDAGALDVAEAFNVLLPSRSGQKVMFEQLLSRLIGESPEKVALDPST